jgi:TonB family protein
VRRPLNASIVGQTRGMMNSSTRSGLLALLGLLGCIHARAPALESRRPTREQLHGTDAPDGATSAPARSKKTYTIVTFFRTVKRQVDAKWEDGSSLREADPDGSKFGARMRSVRLRVQIERAGTLRSANIEASSGIDLLDRAAVTAFQDAAPFPAVPPRLSEDEFISFPFELTYRPAASQQNEPVPKSR